jgi:hypothetical protein
MLIKIIMVFFHENIKSIAGHDAIISEEIESAGLQFASRQPALAAPGTGFLPLDACRRGNGKNLHRHAH